MVTIMAMSAELLEGAKGIDHSELHGTHLFDLTDRVAMVTGAGRGLRRAMAMALATAGADVEHTDHPGMHAEWDAQE